MFNEVRILDPNGKIKKVLSSKVLSRRYWKSFFENPTAGEIRKKAKSPGRKPKKKAVLNYNEMYFSDD